VIVVEIERRAVDFERYHSKRSVVHQHGGASIVGIGLDRRLVVEPRESILKNKQEREAHYQYSIVDREQDRSIMSETLSSSFSK